MHSVARNSSAVGYSRRIHATRYDKGSGQVELPSNASTLGRKAILVHLGAQPHLRNHSQQQQQK